MNRYERLMARVAAGERILIDGATGTEIERRGVPQLENAWNGGGALSHPEILQGVHEDYISEGAEIVIANTFATHRSALRDAGEERDFEAYNRRGVELAVAARAQSKAAEVLVAGGISYWSWIGNWQAPEDLRASAERQAAIMREAGADLIMLEMMVDIDSMLVVLEAARTAGLPVWVGISCKPAEAGAADAGEMILLRGGRLRDALMTLARRDVPLISIMHTEVAYIDACLEVAREAWSGPIGVYAHSARWIDHKCIYDATVTPTDYAALCGSWMERGVQVIGGCCGLGVEHIRALKGLV